VAGKSCERWLSVALGCLAVCNVLAEIELASLVGSHREDRRETAIARERLADVDQRHAITVRHDDRAQAFDAVQQALEELLQITLDHESMHQGVNLRRCGEEWLEPRRVWCATQQQRTAMCVSVIEMAKRAGNDTNEKRESHRRRVVPQRARKTRKPLE